MACKFFLAQVWAESFADRLAIREQSQHSQCSTCLRHKMILRKLGRDRDRLAAQMKAYYQHLQLQYEDRTRYWQSRSLSRLKSLQPDGTLRVTCIVDAMDHCKYRFPRSPIFCSKEFANYIRPTLDATCLICHGHSILVFLSPPHIPKDSSFSVEVLVHGLHMLADVGIDARRVSLHLQADNTSREVKNNSMLRAVGALVAARRLANAKVCHLRSGHSHEDIDQFFSTLTALLETKPVAETPYDYKTILDDFFKDPTVRPLEGMRRVYVVQAVRDWRLGGSVG